MPHEKSVAGSPEDWLRYAVSDLELARVKTPPEVLKEGLCFHAQQAAEKAFKAILVFLSVPFPKTHSIGILVDLLAQHISVPETIDDSVGLTDYAVMSRYPADVEPVSEDEYLEAIRLADCAVSWAKSIIVPKIQDSEKA